MDKKKKRAMAIVIALFLLVTLEIVYIFSELYNENDIPAPVVATKDALKFKSEYEKVNGNDNGHGNTIRTIAIPEVNPMIYATDEDIVKAIDKKESFVVYFGFSTCPWCRSVLPYMLEAAKDKGIDKIYYVDVLNIRDKYELGEKHKAVRTQEGTEGYYQLLERLDPVLSDYAPLTYTKKKKTKKVKIPEKRIYAPNVVIVKNGTPVTLEEGIIDELTDPYMDITYEMGCAIKDRFSCLFDTYQSDSNSCDLSKQKC